jgi:uncharacterized membrane protein YfcA
MASLWIPLLVFLAAAVQSLSGFGFALMVMPLAAIALGLQTAAPLVALVALALNTINVLRYRQDLNLREMARLGLASALGVPAGIWALVSVDEALILRLMGLILVLYAGYTLARPAAPRRCSDRWAYPAGLAAGWLGAAYNTPGPPVVVYGALRQWPKGEFRAVLHGIFFLNGVLVVASHAVARRLTPQVLTSFVYAVPALLLGVLLASRVDRGLNRERFRTLVTVMILVLGSSMILGLG